MQQQKNKQHTTTVVNPGKADVNIQQWLTSYRRQTDKTNESLIEH